MRAAAYARYSTDKQTDNSIAYQLEKIGAYCRANDIEIVATYSDEAESGTNMERPQFRAMLRDAESRRFDAVVIYDISRGSRDVGDWFNFRRSMMMLGIQVISATQRLGDITNSNDFLVELISVGMGQREVLETRSKSIAGVATMAEKGAFLGGVPPLGYDIVDQRYVINEREAKIVRKIFQMYAAGASYEDILEALPGVAGKRGAPLGKNSFHSILRNERYIGIYSWNKRKTKFFRAWAGGAPNPNAVVIPDAIPPIIDKTTWERVQERVSNNKRNAKNKARETYLLSGLIECECCGAAYVGHTSTNKKGYRTKYYVCGNKYRTKTCTAKNVNGNQLEEFVVEHLRAYLAETDFSVVAREIADRINKAARDTRDAKAEIREIDKMLANGMKAIMTGYDVPELRAEMDKLRLRRVELDDLVRMEEQERTHVEPQFIEAIFRESVSDLDAGNLAAAIRRNVKKIYAHSDGSCTVEMGVHMDGCGSAQHSVCATHIAVFVPIPKRLAILERQDPVQI